ncbi:MAG: hypothetical protein U0031_20440 [Thermomicrobiales bacterium]
MKIGSGRSLQGRVVAVAVVYAVAMALLARILFGASGLFGSYTGTLFEYLNEGFGMGRHANAAATIGLVAFFLIPMVVGFVVRDWHWVWLSMVALVFAELLTWIPHLIANERPIPLNAIPWIIVFFGLPAAIGAAIGVSAGRFFAKNRTASRSSFFRSDDLERL